MRANPVSMKLVVRSMSDTVIIVTQYMLLNSVFCSPHIIAVNILPQSLVHSLCFRLTIFRLISSKVKVKFEHLFALLNYIGEAIKEYFTVQ